jgi:hypothetical protein
MIITVTHTRTEERADLDLPNDKGYTMEGAALALADMKHIGDDEEALADSIWQTEYRFWVNAISDAVNAKLLRPVRGTGADEAKENIRTFNGRLSVSQLNQWLKGEHPECKYKFEAITARPAKKKKQTDLPDWRLLVEVEANRLWLKWREQGTNPQKTMLKEPLAKWCITENILTGGKTNPNEDYIYRHMLSGWTPPKDTEKVRKARKALFEE